MLSDIKGVHTLVWKYSFLIPFQDKSWTPFYLIIYGKVSQSGNCKLSLECCHVGCPMFGGGLVCRLMGRVKGFIILLNFI